MDGLVTCHDYFTTASGIGEDAVLYKLSEERSTVVDNARCLAVQCYLNMCQFRYKLMEYGNVDHMSQSRMSPFIAIPTDHSNILLSSFEAIVGYVEAQGAGLASSLESSDRARVTTMASLINNLVVAEQYYTWIHYETYKKGTLSSVGYDKVWPLSFIIPTLDRMGFIWNNFSLYRMKESEVIDDYQQSLWSLSQLLVHDSNSFSSSGKCPLDALVYGHLEAIRSSGIIQLSIPLQDYPNLLEFTDIIKRDRFNVGMLVIEE